MTFASKMWSSQAKDSWRPTRATSSTKSVRRRMQTVIPLLSSKPPSGSPPLDQARRPDWRSIRSARRWLSRTLACSSSPSTRTQPTTTRLLSWHRESTLRQAICRQVLSLSTMSDQKTQASNWSPRTLSSS